MDGQLKEGWRRMKVGREKSYFLKYSDKNKPLLGNNVNNTALCT